MSVIMQKKRLIWFVRNLVSFIQCVSGIRCFFTEFIRKNYCNRISENFLTNYIPHSTKRQLPCVTVLYL